MIVIIVTSFHFWRTISTLRKTFLLYFFQVDINAPSLRLSPFPFSQFLDSGSVCRSFIYLCYHFYRQQVYLLTPATGKSKPQRKKTLHIHFLHSLIDFAGAAIKTILFQCYNGTPLARCEHKPSIWTLTENPIWLFFFFVLFLLFCFDQRYWISPSIKYCCHFVRLSFFYISLGAGSVSVSSSYAIRLHVLCARPHTRCDKLGIRRKAILRYNCCLKCAKCTITFTDEKRIIIIIIARKMGKNQKK